MITINTKAELAIEKVANVTGEASDLLDLIVRASKKSNIDTIPMPVEHVEHIVLCLGLVRELFNKLNPTITRNSNTRVH